VEVTEVSFLVDNLLKRQDNLPASVG
jgi:hypothetical protein